MHKILQTLTLTLGVFLCCGLAAAENLRVAAWNIADFHHELGVEARPDIGTRRYTADFNALKRYARTLGADVVALQEIATEEAARLLYPESEFWLFMSSRYTEEQAAGVGSGIYTAIAVRKGAGITPVTQADLHGLQVNPLPSDPEQARPTRRGTAVLLDVHGSKLWVLSVHLKSSCPTVLKLDQSIQRSCQLLWQQRLVLKRWMDERRLRGEEFIVAGDFNRRFGQLKDRGLLWKYLADVQEEGDEPTVVRYPTTETRKCTTRKGQSPHPIDWFFVSPDLNLRTVKRSYREVRWSRADTDRHGQRLSDHCPIRIDFEY